MTRPNVPLRDGADDDKGHICFVGFRLRSVDVGEVRLPHYAGIRLASGPFSSPAQDALFETRPADRARVMELDRCLFFVDGEAAHYSAVVACAGGTARDSGA